MCGCKTRDILVDKEGIARPIMGRAMCEICGSEREGRTKGDKLAGWMNGERGREGMECESGESNYPT
jgi:hypothetical protein